MRGGLELLAWLQWFQSCSCNWRRSLYLLRMWIQVELIYVSADLDASPYHWKYPNSDSCGAVESYLLALRLNRSAPDSRISSDFTPSKISSVAPVSAIHNWSLICFSVYLQKWPSWIFGVVYELARFSVSSCDVSLRGIHTREARMLVHATFAVLASPVFLCLSGLCWAPCPTYIFSSPIGHGLEKSLLYLEL